MLPFIPITFLATAEIPDHTASVRDRGARAWRVQRLRTGNANALLDGDALTEFCELDDEGWSLLETAAGRFNLSARAHQRILRVSRTIADLAASKKIAPPHVAEAQSFRCLDRPV